MLTDHFNALGMKVAERWARYNFDTEAFPNIAFEEISEARSWEVVPAAEIVTWVTTAALLPLQPNLDSTFGEPPLTLFWHPRFFIEVLLWTTATPDVHQHGFSGAFAIWEGSSIQCRFTFVRERRINSAMWLGRLNIGDVQLLQKGSVQRIEAGPRFIHSTFHLTRPSVTLLVRTHADAEHRPQLSYFQPCLAIDPLNKDPLLTRQLQVLSFLDTIRSSLFENAACSAVRHADLYGSFCILRHLRSVPRASHVFTACVEVAGARHGDDVARLVEVIDELDRLSRIRSLRVAIGRSDLRLYLALLMNVPSYDPIIQVIRELYPKEDAIELVTRWSSEIFGANSCGIEFDEQNKRIFRALLRTRSADAAFADLATESNQTASGTDTDDCRRRLREIQSCAVFRPLFRPSLGVGL